MEVLGNVCFHTKLDLFIRQRIKIVRLDLTLKQISCLNEKKIEHSKTPPFFLKK